MYSAPPHTRRVPSYVHDNISHGKENFGVEGFREEVGEVVYRADERHGEHALFDFLADEEVAPIDMFGASMVLWIIGQRPAWLSMPSEMGSSGLDRPNSMAKARR